jgi:hypothetical protein
MILVLYFNKKWINGLFFLAQSTSMDKFDEHSAFWGDNVWEGL